MWEEPRWDELYLKAVLEANEHKMPERISATRGAISRRLEALELDPNHYAERQQIETALRALSLLEVETQQWADLTADWNKK
jgi:hypothetical protein